MLRIYVFFICPNKPKTIDPKFQFDSEEECIDLMLRREELAEHPVSQGYLTYMAKEACLWRKSITVQFAAV